MGAIRLPRQRTPAQRGGTVSKPSAWVFEDHVTWDAEEGAEWIEEYGEGVGTVRPLYTLPDAALRLAEMLEADARAITNEVTSFGLHRAADRLREIATSERTEELFRALATPTPSQPNPEETTGG